MTANIVGKGADEGKQQDKEHERCIQVSSCHFEVLCRWAFICMGNIGGYKN